MLKIKGSSKNIKYIGIILLIATFCCIIAFGLKIYEFKNKKYKNELVELDIGLYRLESYINKNISDRKIIIVKKRIRIGENEKQIENGYYDLEIFIKNNKSIVIALNKLWKEFDEKLYQDEYINEITNSIKDVLDIDSCDTKIYDFILSGYNIAKNSENKNEINKKYILNVDDYEFKGIIQDKQFVISIYLKS